MNIKITNHVCPHCGYCDHCGRGGRPPYPYGGYYPPYRPIWWSSQSTGNSINQISSSQVSIPNTWSIN